MDLVRRIRNIRWSVDKSFGEVIVICVHAVLASLQDGIGISLMHDSGSEQTKSAVAVFEVIPGEEALEKSLSIKQPFWF